MLLVSLTAVGQHGSAELMAHHVLLRLQVVPKLCRAQ